MSREYTPGDIVDGRFRLVERLGSGGMGHVWRARNTSLDVDVALKQLHVPLNATDNERHDRIARALREGQTLARLKPHPHVIAVHGFLEEKGIPWLIMDLVEGRSLTQVVRDDGLLTAARTAAIGRQLLSALQAVHRQGVRHRDVKPDNVLIAAGDHAVLADFGIAVHADDTALTRTGMVVGTPDYLDPERLRAAPVTSASDMFCLGATLYFAVEGHSPFFRGNNVSATYHAICNERPVPMHNAGPLGPLLSALLSVNPAGRPNADVALAQIDQLLRDAAAPTCTAQPLMTEPPDPIALPQDGYWPTAVAEPQSGQSLTYASPPARRRWAASIPSTNAVHTPSQILFLAFVDLHARAGRPSAPKLAGIGCWPGWDIDVMLRGGSIPFPSWSALSHAVYTLNGDINRFHRLWRDAGRFLTRPGRITPTRSDMPESHGMGFTRPSPEPPAPYIASSQVIPNKRLPPGEPRFRDAIRQLHYLAESPWPKQIAQSPFCKGISVKRVRKVIDGKGYLAPWSAQSAVVRAMGGDVHQFQQLWQAIPISTRLASTVAVGFIVSIVTLVLITTLLATIS